MPRNNPPLPKAPPANRSRVFDPWNSSSTGHQRADNNLSGSTSWRVSRTKKLHAQLAAGFSSGGGKEGEGLYDTVGAGSKEWGVDGRLENGDWDDSNIMGARNKRGIGREWGDLEGWMRGGKVRRLNGPDVEEEEICKGVWDRKAEEVEERGEKRDYDVKEDETITENEDTLPLSQFSHPSPPYSDAEVKHDIPPSMGEQKTEDVTTRPSQKMKRKWKRSEFIQTDEADWVDGIPPSGQRSPPLSSSTSPSPSPELDNVPTSSPSKNIPPPQEETPLPQIFQGLTIFISGSTYRLISDHELKYELTSHGAKISLGLARKLVTHVIIGRANDITSGGKEGAGGGLAAGKIQKEVKLIGGKGIKYVGVEWVLESIKVGQRLPEGKFAEVSTAPAGVRSVMGMFEKARKK